MQPTDTHAATPRNGTAGAAPPWPDDIQESISERLERLRGELCSLMCIIELADFSLETQIDSNTRQAALLDVRMRMSDVAEELELCIATATSISILPPQPMVTGVA